MKRLGSFVVVLLLVGPGFGQDIIPEPTSTGVPVTGVPVRPMAEGSTPLIVESGGADKKGGFLTGDKCFPNFIGFVSNPSLAVDPRSLTQLYPIYGYTSMSAIRPFPSGSIDAAGPGLNLALTERLRLHTRPNFLEPNHPAALAGKVAACENWHRWRKAMEMHGSGGG